MQGSMRVVGTFVFRFFGGLMKVVLLSSCAAAATAALLFSCVSVKSEQPTVVGNPVTATQLAMHSTETDCWVSLNGSVLNLTSFLSEHGGGKSTILPFCGGDISGAFAGKHGTHAGALAAAAHYNVGALAGSTAASYTMAEVGTHNTVADCWMTIEDAVYDVSNFFREVAPNSMVTSATDESANNCGYNEVFKASRDANELTKRGGCSFTNYPLSHMGWSQTTSFVEDKATGSPTYDAGSKGTVKTKTYVLWRGNSLDNKARRVTAAKYCGKDITNLFRGKADITVADYTDSNVADLRRGQTGSVGKAKVYRFDHLSNGYYNDAGVYVPETWKDAGALKKGTTAYAEYPGVAALLLQKFYKGKVAR
jgi:cytochrome b involved in lipid metabolism